MPAPRLTKASLSNALAALKAQGLTPSRVNLNPDGSFNIDIGEELKPEPSQKPKRPKKWGEGRVQ